MKNIFTLVSFKNLQIFDAPAAMISTLKSPTIFVLLNRLRFTLITISIILYIMIYACSWKTTHRNSHFQGVGKIVFCTPLLATGRASATLCSNIRSYALVCSSSINQANKIYNVQQVLQNPEFVESKLLRILLIMKHKNTQQKAARCGIDVYE